jgi:DNA-binding transcriptional LysR family regulator
MIRFNRKDVLQLRFARRISRRDVDPPAHFVPASASFTEAVRLGLGWGLVPEEVARTDIAAGRLVDVAGGLAGAEEKDRSHHLQPADGPPGRRRPGDVLGRRAPVLLDRPVRRHA